MKTFITYLFLSVYIGISFTSCDPSKRLAVNGEKDYSLLSDCGNVTIKCYWGLRMLTIDHHLNGEFTFSPDSLKLGFSPDFMNAKDIKFYVDKIEVLKDEVVPIENNLVRIRFNGDFETILKEDNKTVFILPSNYILCGDKPLITDTVTIKLSEFRLFK